MLGMKHSTATITQVPVTMAPSWSVYLFPVCLGVMSVKQTDWEHICTPHSSTEASPDTEEQAGLLAALCQVSSSAQNLRPSPALAGGEERQGQEMLSSQNLAAACRRGEPG